jgi:hypothetical protein
LLLAQRSGYEQAATSYLLRQDFDYPTQDFATLAKLRIAARIEVLKALSDYAAAMAALNDPQLPANLGAAVTKLGTSVSGLAKVIYPNEDYETITPQINIIGAATTYFVAQANAAAIQSAIRTTHPVLVDAVRLLEADFKIIQGRFDRRLSGLRSLQKQKLVYIRDDQRQTAIELERRFQESYDSDQALSVQVAAIRESTKLLAALLKAHKELEESIDFDRAVTEFKTFADAVALNVAELEKVKK